VRLNDEQMQVSDLIWCLGQDDQPLYTVETGHRLLRPGQALERLSAQEMSLSSSHALALTLLYQLLAQTSQVLDRMDQGLSVSTLSLRGFLSNVGTDYSRGAEDMIDLDSHMATLHKPLSHVMHSIDDLEQAAQRLRRWVYQEKSMNLGRVDELIAAIEGMQRRAHFAIERQRFHWRAAGESVAMSDLNVTKVFTVLWALLVPGTALINWYGQNFHVMPELSWEGTMWVQLVTVLLLTAVPIWTIKKSGALR
jgi:Mg2+ and Co2+ transporter CorA